MTSSISHLIAKTNFPINTKSKSKSKSGRPSPRQKPSAISVAQNECYWGSIEAEIETYLRQTIPVTPPESVLEPMHHLTFTAPRTTASALCVAACEVVGGDRRQALAAASAIHLTHAAAYAHQNLKPVLEHKYGPNVELLTGDGILPFGFELLSRSQSDPTRIIRVIIEIARAGGSQGMKKEGGMHACGAACGAILGGAAEEEIEKLRNFGLYAGMLQGIIAKGNPLMEERIQKMKELAMKELESFRGDTARLHLISQFLPTKLNYVYV